MVILSAESHTSYRSHHYISAVQNQQPKCLDWVHMGLCHCPSDLKPNCCRNRYLDHVLKSNCMCRIVITSSIYIKYSIFQNNNNYLQSSAGSCSFFSMFFDCHVLIANTCHSHVSAFKTDSCHAFCQSSEVKFGALHLFYSSLLSIV